jgi:DNA-directed RNA polymerase omega subunit
LDKKEETMLYQDAEIKALERVSNKYLLTVLVCKRVKQLQRGAKPHIAEDTPNPVDTALKEIAAGKIVLAEPSVEPSPDIVARKNSICKPLKP